MSCKKFSKLQFSSALFAFVFQMSASTAYAAPLDFDGDDLTDLVGVEIQHDDSPNEIAFRIIHSSSGQLQKIEFGKSEETPVVADYDGDGIADLAVVGEGTEGNLLWRIKLSSQSGTLTTVNFGLIDDEVFAGCHFDLDALADMAVIRSRTSLEYQKSSDQQAASFPVDLSSPDGFYCADLNTDGIDELIAYKAISRNLSQIVAWDLGTGNRIVEKSVSVKVVHVFAADVDGDGVKDLGYDKVLGKKKMRLSLIIAGNEQNYDIPIYSKLTFGKYLADQSAEGALLKINRDDTFLQTTSISAISSPTTVAIDDTQTLIPAVVFDTVGPPRSREASCQVQHDPYDGPNGFLWKPVSDTTGNVAIHFPAGMKIRKVKIVKDGKVLETPFYGGNGNGSRDLFRSRKRYSFFPNNVTVLGTYQKAIHCWLVEQVAERID